MKDKKKNEEQFPRTPKPASRDMPFEKKRCAKHKILDCKECFHKQSKS